MNATVKNIELPPDRRVFAVSDIHGNLDCLKGILEKIRFSKEDILLLLGDLVEKGPRNLDTLRYIMELCRTHTVYPLAGNCDDLLTGTAPSEWLFRMRDHWGGRLLMNEFAQKLHFVLRGPEDVEALRREVQEYFPEEWGFLNSLPTILLGGEYVFVHGGIPGEESLGRLEELDRMACMKCDDFLSQDYAFKSRWCVVGHWPVTLYRQLPDCNPIVEAGRQIVSIDGGCSVKQDGQLNALLLPEHPDGRFTWESFDMLPRAAALDDQEPSAEWTNIRYGDSSIRIIRWGKEFSTCLHLSSGNTLELPTSYILQNHKGFFCCEDYTDYRLPVRKGEILSVVNKTSRGYLVKKNGAGGWYTGRAEQLQA